MANRLADALSPYLLQHADNPVDWWPWCDEAFAEARRRGVPVLLSVGYAACHWCHVMAHESFEDPEVAEVLNASFVSVKVDREERPDIDSVYMQATQALTGRGGWPMTCLLTPDGQPFYAGTYFPRNAFLQLLGAVTDSWAAQRDQVVQHGARISAALSGGGVEGPGRPADEDALARAEDRIAADFDRRRGGFGAAPKFPPSMVVEWLIGRHARTGSQRALAMAESTFEAMARGGLYDQLAGGFARYSVDSDWVVPHFEKMLYDNALLLVGYLYWGRVSGSPLARRVAAETADFLLRDLGTPQGAFASALDADAAGVEGLTYAWTPDQLIAALGPQDGRRAAQLLHVTDAGTFEHGSSTLQLRTDPDDPAWWQQTRAVLLEHRRRRPQPARDDKVVTAWNGLAIRGLAEAGRLLDRPDLVTAAQDCADYLCRRHLVDGRLRRTSRDGTVGAAMGVAEDYGNLASGLLALHQATGQARWLEVAGQLLEVALHRFRAEDGGFYDTADDAAELFLRPRTEADNAEPSGQSALAAALLGYGAVTGSARHLHEATEALAACGRVALQQPRFGGLALAAMEAQLAGPLQVAVVHPQIDPDPLAAELLRVVTDAGSPGLVLAHGRPDQPELPLLAGRPLVDGGSAAYLCRGFVCDRPVTDPQELSRALRA